jgi:hypothetical protein
MRFILTSILIVLTLAVSSQIKPSGTYKEYFEQGLYLLLEDNYELAKDNFEAAYKIDSSSANINYQMGICYLNSARKKSIAENYFAKAVKNISRTYKADSPDEKSAPPLAHFYYGKALHVNYKFDDAITQYDEFARYTDAKSKDWKAMVAKEKATTLLAKEAVAAPLNLKVENLGDSINSQYPEYSPVLSADERTLIYTTRRPNSTGGEIGSDGQYYEDIVISYKDDVGRWSKPVSLSSNVNTPGHEASINLSPDGQTLIVYKGESGNGDIFYTTYDGKDWTTLKDFGSDINTKYFESHACLNADVTVLFFASDRPGGFGGRDIYRCVKLPNGNWSKALNMGATVNTPNDEDGAFLHPDGQTFFFASKGAKSIGGFDIFFATLINDDDGVKLIDITNMGVPINTPDDDVFYVTSPDGKRGYYTSAKEGGFGEKDIYRLSIADTRENNLALFKGQIIPAEGEPLPNGLNVIVKEKESGKVVGTYLPKLANGTFATILPPGKEYNFSYQAANGDEFYNEDIFVTNDLTYREIKSEVNLEPVKLIGKVKAKQKSILLNTIVLENSRTKKVVPGAKIMLEEVGGETKTFEANENGRYEGIGLQLEKKYNVYAEHEGIKSPLANISTVGAQSGKIINQILYVKPSAKKATSKELMLGVIVKNSKTFKIIPNATITLKDADGENYNVTTNEKGEVQGIELSPDTKYELSASSSNGSVSKTKTISTQGVKGSKRFMQTLLLDDTESKSPEAPKFEKLSLRKKETSNKLLLGVIVRNSKTLKIIPNVKITLVDADGEYYDVTTNEKGEITGIELSPNTKYEVSGVSSNGSASTRQVFSTGNATKLKKITKTLYIDQPDDVPEESTKTTSNADLAVNYEIFYKYNRNQIDQEDDVWINFINNVVESSKTKIVRIVINSSASKVPTRKFKSNQQLSSLRAKNLQNKITEAVTAKGGEKNKLLFTRKAVVAGPKYKGDWNLGKEKYEKHQFAKAKIK